MNFGQVFRISDHFASFENDHSRTTTNNIESWIASKKDYAACLVGLERCDIFWAASKEPNYCHQLKKLNAAVKEKRPELVNRKGVIFHHDKATPHTSLATRQKLLRLWEVMLHPPLALTLHHQIAIYFNLCITP